MVGSEHYFHSIGCGVIDSVVDQTETSVFEATLSQLHQVEDSSVDVAFDVEQASVEIAFVFIMFECAYIIVHIEVVGHAAAEYCRIAGLFFQCCFVGSSGNVDGEHKCFVDFEIVAFGEFVILHVVFHYERIILKYGIGKHDVLCIDAYCTEKDGSC